VAAPRRHRDRLAAAHWQYLEEQGIHGHLAAALTQQLMIHRPPDALRVSVRAKGTPQVAPPGPC